MWGRGRGRVKGRQIVPVPSGNGRSAQGCRGSVLEQEIGDTHQPLLQSFFAPQGAWHAQQGAGKSRDTVRAHGETAPRLHAAYFFSGTVPQRKCCRPDRRDRGAKARRMILPPHSHPPSALARRPEFAGAAFVQASTPRPCAEEGRRDQTPVPSPADSTEGTKARG